MSAPTPPDPMHRNPETRRAENETLANAFRYTVLLSLLCAQISKDCIFSDDMKNSEYGQMMHVITQVVFSASIPHLIKGDHPWGDTLTLSMAMYQGIFKIFEINSARGPIPCLINTGIGVSAGYSLGTLVNRVFHRPWKFLMHF